MRLALNLGYLVGADDPQDQLRLTRHAEDLGFDSAWAAEAYGSDTPSLLAWLGGQTTRITLGAAVMQIPARTPAMTAMTAASLDRLTDGRFRLGLGVSGPQVSEGWHGVRFDAPLQRTREYLDILELALDRRTVEYHGKHFDLPLPDGPGKPLKLMIRPVSERVPRYLAAIGPKNLQLCGELTDGWLGIFFAPSFAAEQLGHLAAGRAKAGKDLTGFDVLATFPLVVGADLERAAQPVRPYAALYVGGMGSREQNFYNRLAARMGYEAEAEEIQDLYLGGRQRDAMAAVPQQFIDDTSLLGDVSRLADRLQALDAAGLTTCAVSPYGPVEAKLAALTAVAEALDKSGLA
ncbi:LLM class F420-dependent oxidoreductase [Microlunatus endophyticus]|uniref:LLM class F420-dependent oxidoreductase n=1 Tax=Microlunatus endophyticus TaxID=1716077 RepID=A0A917S056_9ACTN|nr:LLM class F420-dependent oxidoreductase [Microlunatus endophyticus]GGL49309.1 LLM class F420-dependent oxidoreductase [Microlunatus endophyticus]